MTDHGDRLSGPPETGAVAFTRAPGMLLRTPAAAAWTRAVDEHRA